MFFYGTRPRIAGTLVNFFCTEVKLFPFNTNEMEDCIVVLFTAIVALASYNDVLFGGGTT